MRLFLILTAAVSAAVLAPARAESPNGVKTLDPPGAIKAVGTWSLGARAGDFIFVAGMQGVDPATNRLVEDPEARIRQAFLNIKTIAQSEGASLKDCVRLTVYLSDLPRYAPMVETAQQELWGGPPYPPRTMIEVKRTKRPAAKVLEQLVAAQWFLSVGSAVAMVQPCMVASKTM